MSEGACSVRCVGGHDAREGTDDMDETQMQYRKGDDGKRSLIRKLAEVMGDVERVPKSGRNDFHKYDYATEADIVSAVRAGMASRLLMMVPTVLSDTWVDRQKGRLVKLRVRFTVHDGESGEEMSFEVLGEGEDQSDKATYKAMTGAVKYALLKLFLIPTGDDPEQDEPPQKGRGQQNQHPRQQLPQGERRAQPAQAPRDTRSEGGGAQAALVAHGGDIIGWGKWTGLKLSEATVEQVRACAEEMRTALASDKPVHNAETLRATQTALAKWLVAKQATPRPEPEAVFGPLKGKKLATLTDAELAGVYDLGVKKLQEPKAADAPWHSAAKKGVAEVEAEIQLREQRKARAATRQPGEEG